MHKKRTIYFVTKSENAPFVLQEAIEKSSEQEVIIFFDLDGARVLDQRYAKKMAREGQYNIVPLFAEALRKGIKLFGCQMNVMGACDMQCIEGVESAGVATFLDLAYEADAVLSY
ncbi:DsrE/DsrF/DrsH-like family protein [Effusibacillus consociatus]|uniref:DsrE/DsrF/DrsH-like family protein n=1 Tax=Effusibacillus consociatus TaxID=1117041 RepID=A0ABV9Q1J4_9BACL